MSCHCPGSPGKAGVSPELRTKLLLIFSPFVFVHPQSRRPSWQGKGWYNVFTTRGSRVLGQSAHNPGKDQTEQKYTFLRWGGAFKIMQLLFFSLKDSFKVQGTVPHAVNKISATSNTVVPSSGCRTLRNVLHCSSCSLPCKPRLQTKHLPTPRALCNARGINVLQH